MRIERKAVLGILSLLLLIGMLTLIFNVQSVRASGTVYIRADGNVDPDTAPITTVDNITYTFTDNIYDEIVVERDNIVVDGAGYTLQGTGSGKGVDLTGRRNVTIKNMEIKQFVFGIYLNHSSSNSIIESDFISITFECIRLYESSNNTIAANNLILNDIDGITLYGSSNNNITQNYLMSNYDGIRLYESSKNSITENIVKENYYGIFLASSSDNNIGNNNVTANHGTGINLYWSSNENTISGNNITSNDYDGLRLEDSDDNVIAGNVVSNNSFDGIALYNSNRNEISRNTIANNSHDGMYLGYYPTSSNDNVIKENFISSNWFGIVHVYSQSNLIYHNSFIGNEKQVHFVPEYSRVNVWDDGYLSGGNYWSDYEDRYPDALELDGSGIWDTPYLIDENNQDNYPLMEPWTPASPIPTTIEDLKTKIEEFGLEGEIDNQGIVRSLSAKLNVAQRLVGKGNVDEAKRVLEDFVKQVQELSGIHVTVEAADILIQSAEYILSHL